MKFLIVGVLIANACLIQAQGKQPKPFSRVDRQLQQNQYQPQQQQNQQDQQYQQQQDDQQYQRVAPKQQQQAQQYQQGKDEYRPRHAESTTFIPIIRFDKEQGDAGSYKASWETGNNIFAQEEGFLKNLGPDPDSKTGEQLNAQVQQGSYSYTSPEGQIITVNYIADETGYHPTGDHLPTPPPVSPEVQKGLDLIYAGIKQQQEAADRDPQLQKQLDYDNNGQYNSRQH